MADLCTVHVHVQPWEKINEGFGPQPMHFFTHAGEDYSSK